MIKIGKDWTLFIDRDGIINYEKEQDYIHTVEEFRFYEDAQAAFSVFAEKFERVIVVTNQKGVGKGLTLPKNLQLIHDHMQREISRGKGRIDRVYFCAETDDTHAMRKPNPGMGLLAKKDFPGIDFSKALMVGNRITDMQFGRNLRITTVYISTTHPDTEAFEELIDYKFDSLKAFASAL